MKFLIMAAIGCTFFVGGILSLIYQLDKLNKKEKLEAFKGVIETCVYQKGTTWSEQQVKDIYKDYLFKLKARKLVVQYPFALTEEQVKRDYLFAQTLTTVGYPKEGLIGDPGAEYTTAVWQTNDEINDARLSVGWHRVTRVYKDGKVKLYYDGLLVSWE